MPLRRLARDERGSVLAIFAIGFPTFILLAALALTFGDWYAHKRQMQNRVDAAAFAAANAYGYLFPACIQDSTLADKITAAAKQYSGVEDPTPLPPPRYVPAGTPLHNTTTDQQVDLAVTVNSTDTTPGTDYSDLPANTGTPCADHSGSAGLGSYWTDVKAKQTVASLFSGFGVPTPTITANARVALSALQGMTGIRPLAIADARYTAGECAWATFENTDSGTITVPLTLQPNGHWHASQDIPVGGVDVHVSATLGDCLVPTQRITYPDVGYIGQFSETNAPTSPEFQGIFFNPTGGCDGLFEPRNAAPCDLGLITVLVDFGAGNQGTSVTVNGTPLIPGGGTVWQGTIATIAAGSGEPGNGTVPIRVDGTYQDIATGTDQPPVSFGQVQSVMAGDDRHEGPIKDFTLSQVEVNNHNTIPGEQIDLVLEPLPSAGPIVITLRGFGGNPVTNSLTGTVDCNELPARSLAEEMQTGCTTSFQVHTPPPYVCSVPADDCIKGRGSGSINAGYDALWAPGGDCTNTPNNWGLYPNIPRGDPRLITIPLTRIGASFSPSETHPIAGFAAFYVTGWEGAPPGCSDPFPPATAQLGDEAWGHFVQFVEPPSGGTPSDQPCIVDGGISACIATLVR